MRKNKAAQQMARLRAKSLTPERRLEIARKAGNESGRVRHARAEAKKRRSFDGKMCAAAQEAVRDVVDGKAADVTGGVAPGADTQAGDK